MTIIPRVELSSGLLTFLALFARVVLMAKQGSFDVVDFRLQSSRRLPFVGQIETVAGWLSRASSSGLWGENEVS